MVEPSGRFLAEWTRRMGLAGGAAVHMQWSTSIASGPPYNKTATEHSQPSFLFLGNRVVVYSGTSLYLIYY